MAEYIERAAAVCIALGAAALGNTAFADRFKIAARLRAIPAADVRPVVRGRWIETKTGFHCSACKSKAKGTKDGALLSNFCPHCGAEMEES